jgi:foldase protein PrsA
MAMQHASAAERYGLKVTPEYMENLKKALDPQYLRARHILVKTPADAEAIIVAFNKGGVFTKLAVDKSLDKNTAPKGGDLGYFKKGDMAPDFEQAIANTQIGKLSAVVKTDLGYHIFQRLK